MSRKMSSCKETVVLNASVQEPEGFTVLTVDILSDVIQQSHDNHMMCCPTGFQCRKKLYRAVLSDFG